jgi:hypothetical protein
MPSCVHAENETLVGAMESCLPKESMESCLLRQSMEGVRVHAYNKNRCHQPRWIVVSVVFRRGLDIQSMPILFDSHEMRAKAPNTKRLPVLQTKIVGPLPSTCRSTQASLSIGKSSTADRVQGTVQ